MTPAAGRSTGRRSPIPTRPDYLGARTIDGTYNDLDDPLMGSIGSRFGRNVPLGHTWPDELPRLLDPNPRVISRELLTRETFEPATTLNLLAGAWIQFEVHDWFSHGDNDPQNAWEIPLEDDDPWPQHPMRVDRTLPDPSSGGGQAEHVRHRRHALVGRLAGLRQHPAVRRRDPDARARQAARSTPMACRRRSSTRTSTSRVWPGTSGSASRCCTRCSCASTTPSATAFTRSTRSCLTRSSTRKRGSSSPR